MKILSFDTTAKTVTAAICEDETLVASYQSETANMQTTEALLPAIELLLKNTATTMNDIDLIAVSAGPGSFTGVRIGVATAKGLALGRDIPCAPVSALEAMAANLADRCGYIIAAMDARRNQLYFAIFKAENGKITRLTDDTADSADFCANQARELGISSAYCVGEGAHIAARALDSEGIKAIFPLSPMSRQFAYGTALCGYKMAKEGKTVKQSELLPIYLRDFGEPDKK